MNRFFLFLEKYLAAGVVLILGLTFRIRNLTKIPRERVIYAFWHRNMIPLMFQRKFEKIVILVSPSKDGELVAAPIRVLGYQTVRGSSSRKGISALKKMIEFSREYSLGITPDGPTGPSEKIKDGLLYLAFQTQLPIVPVAVDVASEWTFDSWDKFRFPKPFSKIQISYGEPIFIRNKEEIDAKTDFVQKAMDDLTEKNKIK